MPRVEGVLLLRPVQREPRSRTAAFEDDGLHHTSPGHPADPSVTGGERGRRYCSDVGFNPFRQQVHRRGDVLIVAAAFVVIAALVAWAIFG